MDQGLQQPQNTVMLPVYENPDRRPGENNPGSTPQLFEQWYVNCYPEIAKNPLQPYSIPNAYLVKRPPVMQTATALSPTIASYGTASTMTCLANCAMQQLTDVYVGAWGDTTNGKIYIIQYRPVAGTTVKIGELTGVSGTGFIFISEIVQQVGGTYPAGTQTPAIAVTYMNTSRTTGAGYYAVSSGGVFTSSSLNSIASTSFPSNLVAGAKVITGPIIQMNGVNYIMTLEGTIYGSGGANGTLYDITSWNTNTIVAASMYPDLGVGVYRYKNSILAVGKSTLEFFQDDAVPPPNSPLGRADQAFIKIGCISPKLVLNVDDSIYWVGYSIDGTLGVWMLDNYTPVKVSLPKLDYAIATFWGTTGAGVLNSLEIANIHYKKHLIVNGIIVDIINGNAYNTLASFDTAGSNASDTFTAGTLRCQIAAYSIEDKTWWGICSSSTITNWKYISCAMSQSFTGSNSWITYVFTNNDSLSPQMHVTPCYFENLCGDGMYVDFLTRTNTIPANYNYVIPMAFQLNTKWFGTQKYKRIKRISVLMDKITRYSPSLHVDSNVYSGYIALSKETMNIDLGTTISSLPTISTVKQFPLTTTAEALGRMTATNWGRCRSAAIAVCILHPAGGRVHGVEVELDAWTR